MNGRDWRIWGAGIMTGIGFAALAGGLWIETLVVMSFGIILLRQEVRR